jgi:hypothetical protein
MEPNTTNLEKMLGSRLDRVEEEVGTLQTGMSKLDAGVQALDRSINRMEVTVTSILSRQHQGTNWGVLATCLGVLITVMSGIGYLTMSPVITNLARLEGTQISSDEKQERDIDKFDERIQREIRDLDTAITKEIDARLNAISDLLDRDIEHNTRELDYLRGYVKQFIADIADTKARMDCMAEEKEKP